MADNSQTNTGSGGDIFRTLQTATSEKWPAGVTAYATTLSAGANVLVVVDLTHGLPVQPQTSSTWAVTQSGTWTVATNADTTIGGTAAPGKMLLVGGKSSDATPQYQPLPLNAGGAAVKVDGSAVTQPVSGTVSAAQSGTWTVATNADATSGGQTAPAKVLVVAGKIQSIPATYGPVPISGDGLSIPVTIQGNPTVQGTVDVTSVVPTTSSTALGKAEDAASASGHTGVYVLSVREDSPSGTTSDDGDYQSFKTDSVGRLWVNAAAVATHAVTQSGTWNVGTVTTVTTVSTVTAVSDAQVQGKAASGATKSGNPVQIGAVFNTTQPTVTTGQAVEVQATARGAQIVATGVDAFTVAVSGTATVSGTVTANAGTNLNTSALALESGGNLATVAAAVRTEDAASADADKGIGALAIRKASPANTSGTDGDYEFLQMSAGRLWCSATVDTALPAGSNTIGALTANQSVNVAQVNGVAPLMGAGNTGTGSPRVTIASDQVAIPVSESGTWTVQPGNTANTTPWLTSDTPATSGGLSIYSFLSTAAVQAAAVKASAGQVYALHFFNKNAAPIYVRLYNMATSPGTGDTVVYRAIVPGNTSGAGFVVPIPPGVAFGTGVGLRCTSAVADNDNTALPANDVMGNVFYK